MYKREKKQEVNNERSTHSRHKYKEVRQKNTEVRVQVNVLVQVKDKKGVVLLKNQKVFGITKNQKRKTKQQLQHLK